MANIQPPSPSSAFLNKALLDENVQYFVLALYWWFSKPIPIALLPYMVFSVFHAATFIRTTVLPKMYPPPPSEGSSSAVPPQTQVGKMIQVWVKSNYDRAMYLTAFAEFFILARVILGALTFQNSFLTPILYAHFIRQRYYQSLFTRYAAGKIRENIDKYAAMSPAALQIWESSKRGITAWVGNTIEPAGGARRTTTPRN
ncbi:hypothetical protein Clacol_003803 [Clathrus columnatus]|uniref:Endoplasmic reticulum protein n=1 Tax=Clathrus columnatus TaxID=1419009 RepID=A0AAV5ACC8_9AGAM|nr:hypothetical protein Clacol_003803 [Clathrus columnatus]